MEIRHGIVIAAAIAAAWVAGAWEVRYFSSDGDDAADGLTSATAWRTLEKLCKDLPAGAEARLRRGDVFYGKADLKPGLSAERPTVLAAYGEGARPEICAYKIAKPDPAVWAYTGTNNLWRIDLGDHSKFDGNHMTRSGNVGFLKVDGRIFGRKFFAKLKQLPVRQWDFIDDGINLTVWSKGNPALVSREICIAPCMGTIPFRNHIEVRDVTVRGTGAHGANGSAIDVRFSDCAFVEIGGSHLFGHGQGVSRYGNGVECWGGCRDVQVRRCEFTDVYDVGFTMQGRNAPFSWENIHATDCVFTRCSQCFEVWLSKCRPGIGMKNCSFMRNRCVDTARGWAYDVRPNKDCATPLLMYTMATDACDILVKDNVFVNSRGRLIYKSGGVSELPESYCIVDNTVVGPTNQPIAYCIGREKADAESKREKSIRAANKFISHL